jgi:leucyl/phenylalanyl-tRNA--protein transferase
MILAYTKLHKLGYTHSVETWKDGKIVGGLYGVSIGRVFSGESMFSIEDNASKLALVHLALYLKSRDYIIIDCQTQSQHLKQFGAEPIPRSLFIKLLKENLNKNLSF